MAHGRKKSILSEHNLFGSNLWSTCHHNRVCAIRLSKSIVLDTGLAAFKYGTAGRIMISVKVSVTNCNRFLLLSKNKATMTILLFSFDKSGQEIRQMKACKMLKHLHLHNISYRAPRSIYCSHQFKCFCMVVNSHDKIEKGVKKAHTY